MDRPTPHSRLAWITGASSGIGAALARELAARGWRLILSARREESLRRLAESVGTERAVAWPLDVTASDAVAQAVTAIEAEHGPLEAVVLNAGDYEPMAAAEFDADLFRRLMEVNYFGVVHALDALLPVMTARARGQILINASLSAYRGLPRAAPYGASKAALLNLAEALHSELQGSGVRVRVINPGFVKTALTDKNRFTMPFLVSPEAAARVIAAGLERSRFEITFPLRFALLMKLLRCLPYGLYFRVTGRLMS